MIVFVSMKWVLQRTQRKHLHSCLAAVYENNFVQGSVFAGNSWQTRKPWSAEWRREGQDRAGICCIKMLIAVLCCWWSWYRVLCMTRAHHAGTMWGLTTLLTSQDHPGWSWSLITGGELKYFSLWRALYWDESLSRKLIGKKFPIVAWFCCWLRYQILMIRTVLQ